jgi:pimeloyl-ACP methyl ester carboxylesterase
LRAHLGARGVPLAAPDLRVPSLEELRVSSMIDAARAAIGGERDRAVLIGSSLGGLTAAYTALLDPRVCALVLLAPAFGLPARWATRLGDDGVARWRAQGWMPMPEDPDGPPRLHHEFLRDALELERRYGAAPDVSVPTLVIHGTRDDVVPVEGSRAFCRGGGEDAVGAGSRATRRLVELDDDHAMYASVPTVCALIDRWLFEPLDR